MAASSSNQLEYDVDADESFPSSSSSQPLIGARVPLRSLLDAYKSSEQFVANIHVCLTQYSEYRAVRGDGNCFYRAYVYTCAMWLKQRLVSHGQSDSSIQAFMQRLRDSLQQLVAHGYEAFTLEDFHAVMIDDVFGWICDNQPDDEQIVAKLNDPGIDPYIVQYARFLTSLYIHLHSGDFLHYLSPSQTLQSLVHSIELPNEECDYLQIVAITAFMAVPVNIVYLDRSQAQGGGGGGGNTSSSNNNNNDSDATSKQLPTYTFPHDAAQSNHKFFMLYRPGHYDILYEK